MRRGVLVMLATLSCGVLAAACGGETDQDAGGLPPQAGVAPTRAQAITLLRELLDTLERGDYEAATRFLLPSVVKDASKARKRMATLIPNREISGAGLDILAARGHYGPLTEVFPEKGTNWAEKAGVDPAKCTALKEGDATVILYWGGKAIRILRLDDVGKLE